MLTLTLSLITILLPAEFDPVSDDFNDFDPVNFNDLEPQHNDVYPSNFIVT